MPPPGSAAQRSQKTFVLGAGCQKGGTTWLYKHFRGSDQFAHGYRKEYHVFDSLDLESERWMRDRILGMAADAVAAAQRGEPADAQALHRASMYSDLGFYVDYFTGLLRRRPRIRAVADLTPDYALLSAKRMSQVKRAFATRGVRTAAVFLMRDPVDRIWSQLRMQAHRQPDRFKDPLHQVLRDRFHQPEYALRSSYHHTIAALDATFDSSEMYCGLYEDLFTIPQIRAISDVVGIDFHKPVFGSHHNVSGRVEQEFPSETVRLVAMHFAEVYETVDKRFPDLDLHKFWPSSRFVL